MKADNLLYSYCIMLVDSYVNTANPTHKYNFKNCTYEWDWHLTFQLAS